MSMLSLSLEVELLWPFMLLPRCGRCGRSATSLQNFLLDVDEAGERLERRLSTYLTMVAVVLRKAD